MIAAAATGLVVSACGEDSPPPTDSSPIVVMAITPTQATVTVGDSVRFFSQVAGGPFSLTSCNQSSTSTAAITLTATGCTAVGLVPGITDIKITASNGAHATARFTVVAR